MNVFAYEIIQIKYNCNTQIVIKYNKINVYINNTNSNNTKI